MGAGQRYDLSFWRKETVLGHIHTLLELGLGRGKMKAWGAGKRI